MENRGATVVITHHVVEGKESSYEAWLDEIGPVCRRSEGNIDWQVIRPIPGLTFRFTVIIRFDTIENLKKWMTSSERRELIEKAKPILAKDDDYYINSGLDFLFRPESASVKPPLRWKQYLVTWSAIYPLSIAVPVLLFPVLDYLGIRFNRYSDGFFLSGTIVFIMVYWLMPNYTRLIKKWLYR
ncbi:antibiotic biosynthesis monooxygenase [Flavobacterium selenitireducens]|uniref:antibiotic biosynthesis monooxygenase n=1 Tax=Flavobacterium selenitireducens TaxID=2722704 RepID=UPI00168C0752|nr:antibiotic biosynthesis monooxygenase [Flavobacterium selenitireducens]MBD3582768.1 antibiotic biosynthesis monooxygenase [Flavobacterium selenitireducens]